jgi:hypothetical protein
MIYMQETDYKWFVENYNDLFKKYGHSYLAIKNKEVIGEYDNFSTAVHETTKTHELGTFIVQHCNGSTSAYTVHIASMNFSSAIT